MIMAGIGTLVQLFTVWKLGAKLPIVMGISFTFVSVTMIFLVSAIETIGDTSAMTNTVLGREVTDKEITGSLACDGLISSLSACFGCMSITSFSQNVGLLAMTKVINRYTIATGAVLRA